MTVPISNVPRRVVLAPSGTGPYSFNFEILTATDIAVYRDDTLLTLTTDYTVTINTNGTGSVTLTASPGAATQITIVGDRTIARATDFTTGGDLFASSLNEELDQQTIFNQQNAEGLQRSIKVPVTDPIDVDIVLPSVASRSGKYLAFDGSGNPIAAAGTAETTPISSAMAPVVEAATISAARTALGLGTIATQNASNVSITGGLITGITDIVVADGGTGASSITANSVILGNGTSALSGNLVAPGASGNILTSNGTTWASVAPAVVITRATEQSTASGTQKDFTGIPSTVKRITIMFDGVSLDSSAHVLVQLGDAGGFETTNYISGSSQASGLESSTSGFVVRVSGSTRIVYGTMIITNITGNTWVSSHACHISGVESSVGGGNKTLSDVLTQVRVTVTSGNFDAGQVNIFYE